MELWQIEVSGNPFKTIESISEDNFYPEDDYQVYPCGLSIDLPSGAGHFSSPYKPDPPDDD